MKGPSPSLLIVVASATAAVAITLSARRAQLESDRQQSRLRALQSLQVYLSPAIRRWKLQRSARSIQWAWKSRRKASERREFAHGPNGNNEQEELLEDRPVSRSTPSSWRARIISALLDDDSNKQYINNMKDAETKDKNPLVDTTPGSLNSSFSLDGDEASDISDYIAEDPLTLEAKSTSSFHPQSKNNSIRYLLFILVASCVCAILSQMGVCPTWAPKTTARKTSLHSLSQNSLRLLETNRNREAILEDKKVETANARRARLAEAMSFSLE